MVFSIERLDSNSIIHGLNEAPTIISTPLPAVMKLNTTNIKWKERSDLDSRHGLQNQWIINKSIIFNKPIYWLSSNFIPENNKKPKFSRKNFTKFFRIENFGFWFFLGTKSEISQYIGLLKIIDLLMILGFYDQWKEKYRHHWQSMRQQQDKMVFNMGQGSYRRSRGSMLIRFWAAGANHMKLFYSITGTDFRKLKTKDNPFIWKIFKLFLKFHFLRIETN